MHEDLIHAWDVTPAQAIAIQQRLRRHVLIENCLGSVRRIAGVDVGFKHHFTITRAAIAVFDFTTLQLIDSAIAECPTTFPYVPGLLSFREIPAVLEALQQLRQEPDLLLCDGQGIAHPRRIGIASHLGVLTGLPTVGVGKTRLVGSHAPVAEERGACADLLHKGEQVGVVVRTRTGVKPVYVSPGHKVNIVTARDYVLACSPRYRLPEPIHHAHRLASSLIEPSHSHR